MVYETASDYVCVFCFSLSALLLNSIITAFKPEYIAERSVSNWLTFCIVTFYNGKEKIYSIITYFREEKMES